MRININKDLLLKAIGIADSVISSKNVNTILSNCLFNVSSDQVEITGTDNEMAIKTKIEAVADSSFSFTAMEKNFQV
jgi:DNA polymerase III sliding clamp (beta) subunit (PCNA family)